MRKAEEWEKAQKVLKKTRKLHPAASQGYKGKPTGVKGVRRPTIGRTPIDQVRSNCGAVCRKDALHVRVPGRCVSLSGLKHCPHVMHYFLCVQCRLLWWGLLGLIVVS